MKLFAAGAAALLLAATQISAGEHPACNDIDFPYRDSTPDELRDIAQSCATPQMTELYYHRARHGELMADHAVMSRLERIERSRSDWSADEDALFIALVETLTATYDLDPLERADIINAAFQHANEIAELRLRGYDLQAKRLREAGIRRR